MGKQPERMPFVDPKLVARLNIMYPPLEYSPDIATEAWAFRGGQRDVILKLKQLIKLQDKER